MLGCLAVLLSWVWVVGMHGGKYGSHARDQSLCKQLVHTFYILVFPSFFPLYCTAHVIFDHFKIRYSI